MHSQRVVSFLTSTDIPLPSSSRHFILCTLSGDAHIVHAHIVHRICTSEHICEAVAFFSSPWDVRNVSLDMCSIFRTNIRVLQSRGRERAAFYYPWILQVLGYFFMYLKKLFSQDIWAIQTSYIDMQWRIISDNACKCTNYNYNVLFNHIMIW